MTRKAKHPLKGTFPLSRDPQVLKGFSFMTADNRKKIEDEFMTREGRQRFGLIWRACAEQAKKTERLESFQRTLDAARLHKKKDKGLRIAYLEFLVGAFPVNTNFLPVGSRRHTSELTQGNLALEKAR